MKPCNLVKVMILYNSKEDENWMPLKVEINSWISFRARRNGGHVRKAAEHDGVESRVKSVSKQRF